MGAAVGLHGAGLREQRLRPLAPIPERAQAPLRPGPLAQERSGLGRPVADLPAQPPACFVIAGPVPGGPPPVFSEGLLAGERPGMAERLRVAGQVEQRGARLLRLPGQMPRQPGELPVAVVQHGAADLRQRPGDGLPRARHGVHVAAVGASRPEHGLRLTQERVALLAPGKAGGIARIGAAMPVERQVRLPGGRARPATRPGSERTAPARADCLSWRARHAAAMRRAAGSRPSACMSRPASSASSAAALRMQLRHAGADGPLLERQPVPPEPPGIVAEPHPLQVPDRRGEPGGRQGVGGRGQGSLQQRRPLLPPCGVLGQVLRRAAPVGGEPAEFGPTPPAVPDAFGEALHFPFPQRHAAHALPARRPGMPACPPAGPRRARAPPPAP